MATAQPAPIAPKARAPRAPQWNEERRAAFLDRLADSSNVAASERAAGMAPGAAYRERRRSPEFRAAWDEALAGGLAAWWPDLGLAIDLDRIPALAADRQALWSQAADADFLSDDEKRQMLGFAPRGAGRTADQGETI
jgi:hypothetical protein